MKFSLLYVIYR